MLTRIFENPWNKVNWKKRKKSKKIIQRIHLVSTLLGTPAQLNAMSIFMMLVPFTCCCHPHWGVDSVVRFSTEVIVSDGVVLDCFIFRGGSDIFSSLVPNNTSSNYELSNKHIDELTLFWQCQQKLNTALDWTGVPGRVATECVFLVWRKKKQVWTAESRKWRLVTFCFIYYFILFYFFGLCMSLFRVAFNLLLSLYFSFSFKMTLNIKNHWDWNEKSIKSVSFSVFRP